MKHPRKLYYLLKIALISSLLMPTVHAQMLYFNNFADSADGWSVKGSPGYRHTTTYASNGVIEERHRFYSQNDVKDTFQHTLQIPNNVTFGPNKTVAVFSKQNFNSRAHCRSVKLSWAPDGEIILHVNIQPQYEIETVDDTDVGGGVSVFLEAFDGQDRIVEKEAILETARASSGETFGVESDVLTYLMIRYAGNINGEGGQGHYFDISVYVSFTGGGARLIPNTNTTEYYSEPYSHYITPTRVKLDSLATVLLDREPILEEIIGASSLDYVGDVIWNF